MDNPYDDPNLCRIRDDVVVTVYPGLAEDSEAIKRFAGSCWGEFSRRIAALEADVARLREPIDDIEMQSAVIRARVEENRRLREALRVLWERTATGGDMADYAVHVFAEKALAGGGA